MATPRTLAHTLTDVARRLAPQLRIISASQPTPSLRTHNLLAVAESAEDARRAVLALESIEQDDERLGTVVMGSVSPDAERERPSADPEGVIHEVGGRVLAGGIGGAAAGAVIVGLGAFLLGAGGWQLAGAAVAGAMMVGVFGIIWVTFAGFGGSDAYRQTFVDHDVTSLTLVSVHTDDPDEAAAARDLLRKTKLPLIEVDRFGHVA